MEEVRGSDKNEEFISIKEIKLASGSAPFSGASGFHGGGDGEVGECVSICGRRSSLFHWVGGGECTGYGASVDLEGE